MTVKSHLNINKKKIYSGLCFRLQLFLSVLLPFLLELQFLGLYGVFDCGTSHGRWKKKKYNKQHPRIAIPKPTSCHTSMATTEN